MLRSPTARGSPGFSLAAPMLRTAISRDKPRRSCASPLLRLASDHLHRLQTVYDERFARRRAGALRDGGAPSIRPTRLREAFTGYERAADIARTARGNGLRRVSPVLRQLV